MITFETEEDFEVAVLQVIRDNLGIDTGYGEYGDGGRSIKLVINYHETISSTTLPTPTIGY